MLVSISFFIQKQKKRKEDWSDFDFYFNKYPPGIYSLKGGIKKKYIKKMSINLIP